MIIFNNIVCISIQSYCQVFIIRDFKLKNIVFIKRNL